MSAKLARSKAFQTHFEQILNFHEIISFREVAVFPQKVNENVSVQT